MKIINLNDFYNYNLTVDSTTISVDSTAYTADMVSIESDKLSINNITPRFYPTDVNITFYNELKETSVTEQCIVVNHNGYMDIPFSYSTFEEGDTFEITVKALDGRHVWRGKAYVTLDDDLQNYRLIKKDNNDIIRF